MPRRTSIRVREGSQSTQSTDSEISNVEEAEVDFTEQDAAVGLIEVIKIIQFY